MEPPPAPACPPTDHDPLTLTPVRAHYLKKSLIQLQFSREIRAITSTTNNSNASTLSYLGPPFSLPPKDAPFLDLPFLRYLFRQYVLTFPFLASAPKDFFPDKVQPFISSLLSRDLNSTSILDDELVDPAGTAKLVSKAERSFSLLLNYGLKTYEKEETVRLSQSDLDRLETIARKRHAKLMKTKDAFEVNVVCVRTVVDRGRVRSKTHEEFIIRTRRSNYKDVYVSRRYGDFRTLYNELRKAHPDEEIRPPPAKDRTYVSSRAPLSPSVSNSPSGSFEHPPSGSNDYLPSSPVPAAAAPSLRLAREKNRLTLRAYLHALMSSATVASSPVIRSFLLADPTSLTDEELEDVQRREEADRTRDEGRKHFSKEVSARVDSLRAIVKGMKGNLLGKDGLTRVFAVIKSTDSVRDLPPDMQAALEWGRISMASTVFHHYVAADDASESLAGLKRIHGSMPYFMLKAALKISNPVAMIRSVLDLFLAQPFGSRSLLQRMFTSSLHEEVKTLEEDIEAVKDKVDDPVMCEKVRQFVYAPKEIQAIHKNDSARENIHLLASVLRSGEEPILSRAQMQRAVRSHRAHQEYLKHRESLADSDDDDGPHNEEAWLFEDLAVLTKLYSRLRDKEQLISLIFESTTADLMKDIITIFYSPLAQVYRAASIADSIGDLQSFINDLIRTVEETEELSQEDPQQTVQTFINLIQRHEQSFYYFVHKVHTKGEGLFSGLMRWIELFLDVVREGLGEPISLEFILPHTGDERRGIMEEIDQVALYHYKLKVAHESKLRRRFGRAGSAGTNGDDEATREIVNGFVRDVSFGDLMRADMLAAEEEEESDDSYESSSEFESASGDSETGSEEESGENTSRPVIQLRTAPSTPSLPSAAAPRRAQQQRSFPSPQPSVPQSNLAFPPSSKSASPSPAPPLAHSPSAASAGTRLRKLSQTLRKTRSMTFDSARQALSKTNNAEASAPSTPPPLPPVPPLPPSVARSRSTAPSKPLPPPPPPSPPAATRAPRARRQTQSSSTSTLQPPQNPANAETTQRRYAASPKPPRAQSSKKQGMQAPPGSSLKPPALEKIPELLPLFVEMVRSTSLEL
ncbi:hypothetical protein F5148DRAFT_281422 [Russula earlei]|uniref:Uncharacterized protein n=1 Tax=Russula earlei TaxID=71964 RepID=A0ACC0UQ33_9AGAM|nr:hypothetical protein F5148DRAFT_281422 [Russula earlei]